jgi:hypothetical protein
VQEFGRLVHVGIFEDKLVDAESSTFTEAIAIARQCPPANENKTSGGVPVLLGEIGATRCGFTRDTINSATVRDEF